MAESLLPRARLDTVAPWIISCEETFGPVIGALRLLIHSGRSREALTSIATHRDQAKQQLRRLRLTKLYLLEALALEETHAHAEALAAMRRAVETGHRSGALRLFIDEGRRCQMLLQALSIQSAVRDPEALAYLEQLRGAFPSTDAEVPAADRPEPAAEPLSARERQILQRLAMGFSNLAVGQQLFLSPNTVKWHLAQLYGKLGVNNRTQAVHVARQLHLLS
jgi:LuxR family maltose regulon positive regulatory protein